MRPRMSHWLCLDRTVQLFWVFDCCVCLLGAGSYKGAHSKCIAGTWQTWTCKELNKGGQSNNYEGDFLITKNGDIRELIKIYIFQNAIHCNLNGARNVVAVWWKVLSVVFSSGSKAMYSVVSSKVAVWLLRRRRELGAQLSTGFMFVILCLARRVLPLCGVQYATDTRVKLGSTVCKTSGCPVFPSIITIVPYPTLTWAWSQLLHVPH